MNGRRAVLGGAGAIAAATAFGLVIAPGVADVPPIDTLVALTAGLDRTQAVLLASAVVAGYVVLARAAGGRSEPPPDLFDRACRNPPETPTTHTTAQTAGRTDATIDRAVAGEQRAVTEVRHGLAATAAAVHAAATDTDRTRAEAAVEAGEWTEDPVAAAFLASSESPPIGARLRLWLMPRRERRRRIERTLAAIERTQTQDDG